MKFRKMFFLVIYCFCSGCGPLYNTYTLFSDYSHYCAEPRLRFTWPEDSLQNMEITEDFQLERSVEAFCVESAESRNLVLPVSIIPPMLITKG